MANSTVSHWLPQAEVASRKYSIPVNVLLGLVQIESGGHEGETSPTGAQGLTQFEPGTAKGYHVNVTPGHAYSQLEGAAHYLHDLGFAQDPTKALASYNAGPGNYRAGLGYAQNVLDTSKAYGGLKAPKAPATSTPSAAASPAGSVSSTGLSDPRKLAAVALLLGQQGPYGQNTQALELLQQKLTSPGTAQPVQTGTTPKATVTQPSKGSATANGVVQFADSRIGHYAENLGPNQGTELNGLEKKAGMTAQQWCSIFATTAVVHGGAGVQARTASVSQLATWASEGSHGYRKGILPVSQARPGDLIIRGGEHVGVVTGRQGKNIVVTEGNANGSGGVVKRVYPPGRWTGVVRPK